MDDGMSQMFLAKIMEYEGKIAKLESAVNSQTDYVKNMETNFKENMKEFRDRDKEIYSLVKDMGEGLAHLRGAAEKGDVNVNFEADNIKGVDARSSTTINQDIKKDG